MNCIYCREREATVNDLFCQTCADQLSQEDMQKLRNTMVGQGMLLAKARDEFVQEIKKPFDRILTNLDLPRLVLILGISTMLLIAAILLISK